jgi:hypothetical protein
MWITAEIIAATKLALDPAMTAQFGLRPKRLSKEVIIAKSPTGSKLKKSRYAQLLPAWDSVMK